MNKNTAPWAQQVCELYASEKLDITTFEKAKEIVAAQEDPQAKMMLPIVTHVLNTAKKANEYRPSQWELGKTTWELAKELMLAVREGLGDESL